MPHTSLGALAPLLRINISLVLASASPRRKQILEQLGMKFRILPSTINEDIVPTSLSPEHYVETLASHKARNVASVLASELISNTITPTLVLAADTTVVFDGTILNKPSSPDHARQMLRLLSGRTHTVYTGIAIAEVANKQVSDAADNPQHGLLSKQSSSPTLLLSAVCATNVLFRVLRDEEIDAYVATGSPMDKAGSYGIQDDLGAIFVERIDGCYYNVVGLPLATLYDLLQRYAQHYFFGEASDK